MNNRTPISKRVPARYLVLSAAVVTLLAPLVLSAGTDTPGVAEASSGFAVLLFGFVFGLKHAFDADHLVAVGAIVSERRNPLAAASVGAMWGAGHTLSLVVMGLCVVALRMRIPEEAALVLEFGVAVMITGLGIGLLYRMIRHRGASLHFHGHAHGAVWHVHPHLHYRGGDGEGPPHHHRVRRDRKPFLVGMVHGLAGSATLMLLVLSEISSPVLGLLYILLFGLGSIVGMLMVGLLLSLPYAFLSRRFRRFDLVLRVGAAAVSVGFGSYLMYEIGVVGGLLM